MKIISAFLPLLGCFLFAPSGRAQVCSGIGTRQITVENCSATQAPSEAFLTITPNPASDYVLVQNDGPALQWALHDLRGRVVLSRTIAAGTTITLDTRQIPAGLYLACWRSAPVFKVYFLRLEIFHK